MIGGTIFVDFKSFGGTAIIRVVLSADIFVFCISFVCGVRAQQVYPTPAPHDDTGYISIFDGKTLDAWEGDPKYWRVEKGELVGEVTPQTLLKRNTFVIWRGGKPRDFELKVDFRVTKGGNSGINYRSEEIDGVRFALRGYQCDVDGAKKYTGQNYEEKGRTFFGAARRCVAGGCGWSCAHHRFCRRKRRTG